MNGTPRKIVDDVFGLTDIEVQIVRALCAGRNCEGVGLIVGLSKYTVSDYIKSAYKKMGVYERAALGVKAERAGLLVGVEV